MFLWTQCGRLRDHGVRTGVETGSVETGWKASSGMSHRDLWEEVLKIVEAM